MKEENVAERVMNDCSLLYKMRHASMMETCMCWGWECGDGWNGVLERLSYELETVNILFYPKYKLRIQADQVKEKYGTLHFYYSVVDDSKTFRDVVSKPIWLLSKFIQKHVDFGMKKVVLEPEREEKVHKELTKVEFIEESYYHKNNKDVEVYEKDGKYYKDQVVKHYAKTRFEPERHKLLYKFNEKLVDLWASISYAGSKCDKTKYIVSQHMETVAEKLIQEAERDCMNVCEHCGAYLNDKTRCKTSGWITYICQSCADKSNNRYVMNGEVWQGYKRLQTAKEHQKEIEKFEKKYRSKESEYEKFKEELRKAKAEELEKEIEKGVK